MKRYAVLILLLITLMATLNGQVNRYMPGFSWTHPRIMAMGGNVVADPTGFSAFPSNPAGFVGEKEILTSRVKNELGEKVEKREVVTKTEFTLLSIQANAVANPFAALRLNDRLEAGDDAFAVFLDYAVEELENNGLGADVDVALASYVGNGWGLGSFVSAGALFPQSDLALTTDGEIRADATFLLGYAREIPLGEWDLTLGLDVRPTFKYVVPLTADALINNALEDATSLPALSGFGIGFDMGTTLEWREFTAAFSVSDLFHTRYMMYEAPLSQFGNFSSEVALDDVYVTPMVLNFGLAYEPVFSPLSWLVEPTLVLAYDSELLLGIDALSFYGFTQSSFFKNLHAGIETLWLDAVYLRAGLNSGYFTAGLGIDFFFGQFNLAMYSRETGRTAGQTAQLGTSVELAFRW